MDTTRLTIRLPTEDIEFARRYARAHRLSVAELIDRQLRFLRSNAGAIHPEVTGMTGVIRAEASPDVGQD